MPWTADPRTGGFTAGTPWEPLAPGVATANVATESADPASLLATYRALIRLHETQLPLQAGATVPVAATGPLVAWLRVTADDAQLVLANTSASAVSDYSLSLDRGPLCSSSGEPPMVLDSVNLGGPAGVPAAPARTVAGGFELYRPVAILPAHAGLVIDLGRP
jgi:glycosidase